MQQELCPNCGHDWSAHGAYIAKQERMCEERLDGKHAGYTLRIHYTDQNNLWYACAYEGDDLVFVCRKWGETAISQCKAAITRRIKADETEPPDLVVEQMNRIESPGYNELGEDEPYYVHPEDR